MLLSFALMGLSILTIALTPSYQSIGLAAPVIVIAARMAQGFASETASDQDLKTRPESGALAGW